ncbi:hypothetical protein LTR85_001052 [Meristemomyces frigidus]|nr:hypothetical protein LTR85_001052 [Meristemomyces frigidus]
MAPFLPPELWDRIVSFIPEVDSAHAWTHARLVSRHWKAQIEKQFKEDYVSNPKAMYVYFDCGVDYIPDEETGREMSLSMQMVFDRFDPNNGARCIFREGRTRVFSHSNRGAEWKRAWTRSKYGAWRENIEMYLGEEGGEPGDRRCDMPPFQICIAGYLVNDTELPDFSVDYRKREISFVWFGALNNHLCEASEISRRHGLSIARLQRDIERSGRTVGAIGLPDTYEGMSRLVKGYQRMTVGNRKRVRRERIGRWYNVKHGCGFDDDALFDAVDEAESLRQIARLEARDSDEDEDEDTS